MGTQRQRKSTMDIVPEEEAVDKQWREVRYRHSPSFVDVLSELHASDISGRQARGDRDGRRSSLFFLPSI
jgi:hypothetical protein